MPDEFDLAVSRFVGALEQVFHHDWEYTRSMMACIPTEPTKIDPEDDDPVIAPPDGSAKPTFLWPQLTEYWESEDWGSRGWLLSEYRRLLAAMDQRGLKPIPPFPDSEPNVVAPKEKNR